jgi:hypothetical protein
MLRASKWCFVSTLLIIIGVSGYGGTSSGRTWISSFEAGQYDEAGQFLGGTELMNLVAYKGQLYAGNGYWKDTPAGDDPSPGPQIIVLDSPEGSWTLDHSFLDTLPDGRLRFTRTASLKAVTFSTDGSGSLLPKPVSMLVAGFDGFPGAVFSRNDDSGQWTELTIPADAGFETFRALGFYHDPITRTDLLFAGGGRTIGQCTQLGDPPCGLIYSGVYDSSAPGRIRWTNTPEFTESDFRVMAFAECNGYLYFIAGKNLYRRVVNGGSPEWALAKSFSQLVTPSGSEGLRGLTTIRGGSGEVLLAGVEGVPGYVIRIDPRNNYSTTVELNIGQYLRKRWGSLDHPYVIPAYDDVPSIRDPATGSMLYLIGLEAQNPVRSKRNSAWYLIRDSYAHYYLHEIPSVVPGQRLVAVRTMIESPFPQPGALQLYAGGPDAGFLAHPHNTAWVYCTDNK